MTVTTRRRAAGGLAAALLLAGAATGSVTASAEDAPQSTATLSSATPSGSTLRVTGTAALVPLAPVQVSTDAAGDAPVPGADLVSASITALGDGTTAFELGIGNFAPAAGSPPAVLHHNWGFSVTRGTTVQTFVLKAVNRGAVIASGLDGSSAPDAPSFALQTCTPDPQTGQNTCTSQYLAGEVTADAVRFLVPTASLQGPGATVAAAGQGFNTSYGASDVLWTTNGLGGDTMAGGAAFTMPTAEVRLGLAPAGTPVDAVALTDAKDLTGTAFSTTLPRPAAGSYVLVAQACHGDTCGPRTSRAVTVS